MDRDTMQKALDELYKKELDTSRLREIFNDEKMLKKISAPFLINVDQSYLDAKIKILFVGKETNKWWGKLSDFIDMPDSIEILKDRYRAEFFGGEVKSKQSSLTNYKAENWGNPFFTEYKKIRKALLDNKKGALVWSNLLKMDFDSGKGYSKNSKDIEAIVSISKHIFKKELEILKPDVIIFATSYTYDKIIKNYYNNQDLETIEIIEPKSLWKFKIGKTICYRTWHPSTITYKAEKNKLEYYKDVILDIKNDTQT